MPRFWTGAGALVVLACLTAGCAIVSEEFSGIRNLVVDSLDTPLERDVQIKLGGLTFFILRSLASVIPDGDDPDLIMIKQALNSVRKLEVAVYSLRNGRRPGSDVFAKVNNRMESEGWAYIVRHYEDGELVVMIYMPENLERGRLEDIFVIVLDREVLVMVQISGNLEKLAELAIRESGRYTGNTFQTE